MKVRASLKKRTPECKIVRRNGLSLIHILQAGFAQFFGGTSLLILVGVVLVTLQQVESHLLMRHYDGLLKSCLLYTSRNRERSIALSCSKASYYNEVCRKT